MASIPQSFGLEAAWVYSSKWSKCVWFGADSRRAIKVEDSLEVTFTLSDRYGEKNPTKGVFIVSQPSMANFQGIGRLSMWWCSDGLRVGSRR